MKIGVIADDFTGGSDIALTLAENGMRVTQYVGVPRGQAATDVDAGVVALKSRTSPAAEAVAQSLAACRWLLAQGAGQIVFKICSTFDSTNDGNIGPVAAALAELLGEDRVIVCPALPAYGRSVYMGHLFVGDRLLSESGMQDHPLTPMTDPDLRRVLGAQTEWPIAHVPANTVGQGQQAIAAAVSGALEPAQLADWAVNQAAAPMIYTSADPDSVREAQAEFGRGRAAGAIESFFAQLARALELRGVRRIVVAGGETSGSVVNGLGANTLQIGPRLAAGVPLVRVAGRDLALALKSGNFGGEGIFAEALAAMERPA